MILRYWVWSKDRTKKNRKRVFVREIEALFRHALHTQRMTRSDYRRCCLRTDADGPCRFAIIVQILEHLQVVERDADGYRSVKAEQARQLLS